MSTGALSREPAETNVGSEIPTRKTQVPRVPMRLQILFSGQMFQVSFCWIYSESSNGLIRGILGSSSHVWGKLQKQYVCGDCIGARGP